MPFEYKPPEYKPPQKGLTNLYKPRAYIRDFTVCEEGLHSASLYSEYTEKCDILQKNIVLTLPEEGYVT